MYSQIYSAALQLNKANYCVTDAAHLLDLDLSIIGPVLFAFRKEPYVDLLRMKFQFSS